ncbi:GDSL-type esterase/lipase family protein [Marinomonas mediterranea]|uniref:GDSL-type esterase/lipase family protein n=1 Tax=Marinomonas mediterranea TaxID=119864 RepID=UPI002349A884|nr:GDSL-type esterase/lipase family protein [Marinomonas mediterranea]WCN09577.1 hypothetical protein GV055_11910 [Marinomonas mediterranea]WCN13662.1 hypothetical protein GV054_11950 [Marinomonas mediterranea]
MPAETPLYDLFRSKAIDQNISFDASNATIEKFEALASRTTFTSQTVLAEQNGIAKHLSFLLDGKATFTKHRTSEAITIATTQVAFSPLGISGLNSPGRYMSQIEVEEKSEVITLQLKELRELFISDPAFATAFLSLVLACATSLLWQTRGLKTSPTPLEGDVSKGVSHSTDYDIVRRVGESAFFAPFTKESLEALIPFSELRLYSKGETINKEGEPSNNVNILFSGRLLASFTDNRSESQTQKSRAVARPGVALSWSNGRSRLPAPYTLIASRDTTMLCLSEDNMRRLVDEAPSLACTLLLQQIWQIGRYQQTAAGLANGEIDDVASHMEALLEDNKARIPVTSSLYSTPHSLRNRFTVGNALNAIYDAVIHGNDAERSIAGLMIDLLHGVERQHRFFKSLTAVYNRVAGAPASMSSQRVRELSNSDFARAFDQVAYVIKGMENLPETATNIFFYNHLAAIEDNDLANGHAFSIDSQFISSKILLPKYGDSGQRIVRSSRNTEFWRNGYYARLDNIFVDNAESDWIDETPEEKQQRKERLFLEAQRVFDKGRPLAIAPEGTSETEDNLTTTSPGPLKPGAFLLAAKLKPEPYLVPIALANFDYPVSHTTYAAVIKPPFKISDYVKNVDDKDEMNAFLVEYRKTFRGYVEEARELADLVQSNSGTLPDGLVTNAGLVSPIEEEFETDVRDLESRLWEKQQRSKIALFGSSTFRLWEDAEYDIGLPDIINLGFGGASLIACRTYFKRLVTVHNPDTLIIYVGDNDIGSSASGDQVAHEFRLFMSEVNEQLPHTKCYFISIKPSPFRKHLLPAIQRANELIYQTIEQDDQWRYIDFHSPMLNQDGTPSGAFYDDDPLHVNLAGYGLLGKLIRDALRKG